MIVCRLREGFKKNISLMAKNVSRPFNGIQKLSYGIYKFWELWKYGYMVPAVYVFRQILAYSVAFRSQEDLNIYICLNSHI